MQKINVKRITVDEKLSENLFRFLTCNLKKDKTRFIDRTDEWTEEKEKIVTPQNYYRALKTKKIQAPKWDSLTEGQVYLSGTFQIIGDQQKPKYFITDPQQQNFERIDNYPIIKEGLQNLYSDILKRR